MRKLVRFSPDRHAREPTGGLRADAQCSEEQRWEAIARTKTKFMGWTVQEIKSLPTSMKPNGMGERSYSGQATFWVVNKTGRDKKAKEVESTVEVVVKTDNAGTVLVDEDGKPKLEARFAW